MIERDRRPLGKNRTKKLTIRIDEQTHRKLKVFCARSPFTMNEVVVKLIEDMLRKNSDGI